MWKRFMHDYLSYSYKERAGIFTLITLIMICVFIPVLYPYLIPERKFDQSKFAGEIARLKRRNPDSSFYSKDASGDGSVNGRSYNAGKSEHARETYEVFSFDPNTAAAADWKRLGIRDKTIETIQKYLAKGGHFYKPEDISKIWGLRPGDVKRLLPYVTIRRNEIAAKKESPYPPAYPKQAFNTTRRVLDINEADTAALITLPGIGSKLAQRIINFRNKLGGYYAVDQVAETFGLPDSTFRKIRAYLTVTNNTVRKIDINAASVDDMKVHPYIRYNIANAIIQYRTQHGNFASVADLKKVMIVTDDVYNKLAPYLSIN